MFGKSILREDRSVIDFLTANYTFVNERLAKHYGMPNIYGNQFRRVTITDPARRGLLGQGSVLTVSSYVNRTSPVLRGKWVLTIVTDAAKKDYKFSSIVLGIVKSPPFQMQVKVTPSVTSAANVGGAVRAESR